MICLLEVELYIQGCSKGVATLFNRLESNRPVNFWLAFAEQIEIWSIEYTNQPRHFLILVVFVFS